MHKLKIYNELVITTTDKFKIIQNVKMEYKNFIQKIWLLIKKILDEKYVIFL